MFVGIDTHALSAPAFASALEVFAANEIDVNGGPADPNVTNWIEHATNGLLESNLAGVRRRSYDRARKSPRVRRHDYIGSYVADLVNVVDMEAIRSSGVRIGIDPLSGASCHFWQPIIETYGIAATIVNDAIDLTFRFMTVDWDGKTRMDCSSPYAMARLIAMRPKFDVAFANDTDADRHGIVIRSNGLMSPNHYLAPAVAYQGSTSRHAHAESTPFLLSPTGAKRKSSHSDPRRARNRSGTHDFSHRISSNRQET